MGAQCDGETGRGHWRRKRGHLEERDPESGSWQHVQSRGPLAKPFCCEPVPDPGHTAVTKADIHTIVEVST